MTRTLLLTTASLGLVLANAARAQQAAPAAGADDPRKDIIVTAPREQEKAVDTKRDAFNIVEVQSAEQIAKYPDFNSAEALSRVPGVSLSLDTGEGRFVNIRGIDANLNGATYGGVVLLNTNPGGTVFGSGRAVEFDTIPTGAIDGFIVTKTGMPNHEAEGLGGSIELTPRSAANAEHPFADGAVGYGYEPEHDHGGPLNLDLAVGGAFGPDKQFSIVLTGSYRADRRGFDDIEEDYVDDPNLTSASSTPFTQRQVNHAVADYQLRRYEYHRRRFGYGGTLEWNPNPDHQLYLRASIAGYVESASKNRLTYDNLQSDTLQPDPGNPRGYLTTTSLSIKGTNEEETHRNQIYVIGGRDRFGAFNIDYRASYSKATFRVSRNYNSNFAGPDNVPFAYDNTDPNFPTLTVVGGAVNVNDPSLYTLKSISSSTEYANDHEWSYAANGALDTSWIGEHDRLQFGGEARLRTKTDGQYAQTVSPGTPSLATLSKPAYTDFYGNRYTNGPFIDEPAIATLAQAPSTTALTLTPSSFFRAKEDVYAGYAMYTIDAGAFGGLAGVRVEHTRARYSAYSSGVDANGNDLPQTLTTRPRDYTNAFPTVQVRYKFPHDIVARATYSTGIGRPGFSQVSAATSIDFSNGAISEGNPNLKPTTGNNFDVSIEKYLPAGGLLSVGFFDKEFSNYIVARRVVGADPRLPGFGVSVVNSTYLNVNSARARGIEAAYDQRFAFLPAPFDGIGLSGNFTYVDSKIQLHQADPGQPAPPAQQLPATSRYTWNAALYYEAHKVQLRLAGQYVGRNLFGVGSDITRDIYQSPRFTLDLTAGYDVTRNFRAYFNVRNLTNQPLRIYESVPSRPIQREFYDQTYEAGVKFKF